MKSGILGLVHGGFEDINPTVSTIEHDGEELQRCIEISQEFTLDSGVRIQIGNVAREEYVKRERSKIENGRVHVDSAHEKQTDHTRFVAISDEFLILDSSSGQYAFDILGRETEALIERAEIDLDSFVSDHAEATYWQFGFYGTGLNADNGVFYGLDIAEEPSAEPFIGSSSANQIGVEYLYQDTPVKAKITESGFVEVYQPSEWESSEFSQFVLDEISTYVRSP